MNTLDLAFAVRGSAIPRDHGHALYGALSRALPPLHGATWLGVHPLAGTPLDDHRLALRDGARLILRVPTERIPDVLPLAGKSIEVGGSSLVLGVPSVSALVPAASLDARLVVVKLTEPPFRRNESLARDTLNVTDFAERYIVALTKQLVALGITSPPLLQGRRSLAISGRRVVGYSVRVCALTAEQSVALQAHGLGGKRRMGCGIFRPTRLKTASASRMEGPAT